MKECNWREEREKYKVPFRKEQKVIARQEGGGPPASQTPQPSIQPQQVITPPSKGGVWKVAVIMAILALLGGIGIPKIINHRKVQVDNDSESDIQVANGKHGGGGGKPKPHLASTGKPVSDSAMMLANVSDKYKQAVGVVVLWVKNSAGKVNKYECGTVWAFAPDKFATNAHVAYAMKKNAQLFIQYLVTKKFVEKIERIEREKAFAQEKSNADTVISGTAAMQNNPFSMSGDGSISLLDIEKKCADENAKNAKKLKEYQEKVGEELMFKQMDETKEHVLKHIIPDMGCAILINQSDMSLPVISVQVHPKYEAVKGVFTQDVAILTVGTKMKDYFPIANKECLRDLKSGMPVGFLGFPSETLGGLGKNENVNLDAPIATMQTGIITSVTNFDYEDAGFSGNFCIRHNLPSAGGASGSPIFNTKGQVVALLNGGNHFLVPYIDDQGKPVFDANGKLDRTRYPNAAMVGFGVRVDLLEGVSGVPVPIQEWLRNK